MEDPKSSEDRQDEEPEVIADLDVTEEDAGELRGGRIRGGNTETCGAGRTA